MKDDLIDDAGFELGTLKVEHERLRWKLSDLYRRESGKEAGKMVYQYGDHKVKPW